MAENSLQNPKNEVSFVLSDNAKAIIEKFEEKLRYGNYTAEEKNGIRAELVWQLLRKQYPETCNDIEDSETLVPTIDEEDLLFFGLLLLFLATPKAASPELVDSKQIEVLYEELPAVLNYYYFRIINYQAYKVVLGNDKDYELCLELCGNSQNMSVFLDHAGYNPLFWILSTYTDSNMNHAIPDELFDFVIFDQDQHSADEGYCYLHGTTIELKDFISNYLSPNGTLFYRSPESWINNTGWFPFRKWVVDNKYLHGIIKLPRTRRGGQILVIGEQPAKNIYIVDARFGFTKDNSLDVEKVLEVIRKKNPDNYKEMSFEDFMLNNDYYNTNIARFFPLPLDSTHKVAKFEVELGELVDLYESKTLYDVSCYFLNRKYFYENDLYDSVEAVVMPYARRVPNDHFFLFKWDEPSESFLCAYHNYGDFDLDNHSSTGVYCENDSNGNPIICTYPDAIIFKLKDYPEVPIDPYYLNKILNSSEEVQVRLKQIQLPDWETSIEKEDFLSIVVTVPSMEEQQRILDLDRQKALADTKEEIKKSFEAYRQDIRMKKHALAQRLRVMKNWWQNLQAARKDGNGILDDEATIGKLHPISVKEIYSQIDREMNMLFKQVNAFNLGDTMASEVFDAKEFVQQYVKHHDPIFEYQCELPQGTANIRFPKDALQIILDNIASNACSHGFKRRENESNIIRIVMEIKGHDLIVRIGNNGNPLSPSMTAEKVFTYGDTTEEGIGEHGGLGGFQVKDLMSKFGNVVELELDENAEFPVVYKLVFRDVNIYK